MIAIDANILSLLINEHCTVPGDFRDGLPIPQAHEKINALIANLQQAGERVLIPTPALAEALIPLAPTFDDHLSQLEQSANFRIAGFGTRAATELALRVSAAMTKGDKRDFMGAPWSKVNFDRQVVAIALVEGRRQSTPPTETSITMPRSGGYPPRTWGMSHWLRRSNRPYSITRNKS